MSRTILHCDLNSCYASIEILYNPQLQGKAVVVSASTDSKNGIVLAKSELAKQAGIKTGDVMWQARAKCQDLIIVPPHFDRYFSHSRLVQELYYQYTDQVEPFGLDECWLDVSASVNKYGSGEQIAHLIRERIKREIGLTVSIGVSFNKVFAKLGSDLKKPDAVTIITKEGFQKQIWHLPAQSLIGIGSKTASKLALYNIVSIGDLAKANSDFLEKILGKNGLELKEFALGQDSSRVKPAALELPVKSVGHGITCKRNLKNRREVRQVFQALSKKVGIRLRRYGLVANTVQIAVRDSNLHTIQLQGPLNYTSQNSVDLINKAMSLFDEEYDFLRDIRSLTIRALSLEERQSKQIYLGQKFQDHCRWEEIEQVMDYLDQRFGEGSTNFASLLKRDELVEEISDIIVLPAQSYQ